jgi:anti-sigma28 factor (negative regulator of flagellin synthesis)
VGSVKIDEVSNVPELPQIRQGDIQREAELQRQNVQPPTPPDQVEISQAARFTQDQNPAARVEKLKQALDRGLQVSSGEIAKALVRDGAVK